MRYLAVSFLFLSACNNNLVRNGAKSSRNYENYRYALQPVDLKEISNAELAGKNAGLYLRSATYHCYGTLTDMIDLRIKHLMIHMKQLH
jgi:hypothetical protein